MTEDIKAAMIKPKPIPPVIASGISLTVDTNIKQARAPIAQ